MLTGKLLCLWEFLCYCQHFSKLHKNQQRVAVAVLGKKASTCKRMLPDWVIGEIGQPVAFLGTQGSSSLLISSPASRWVSFPIHMQNFFCLLLHLGKTAHAWPLLWHSLCSSYHTLHPCQVILEFPWVLFQIPQTNEVNFKDIEVIW